MIPEAKWTPESLKVASRSIFSCRWSLCHHWEYLGNSQSQSASEASTLCLVRENIGLNSCGPRHCMYLHIGVLFVEDKSVVNAAATRKWIGRIACVLS
jgi:hypothetical protein